MTDYQRQIAFSKALRKTQKVGDCWVWQGPVCTKGYAQVSVGGRNHLLHRLAYTVTTGQEIPAGHVIDHLCHDPSVCAGGSCIHRRCVNPDHLAVVTNAQNLRRQTPAFKQACVNGHDYDLLNTGTTPEGRRICKECNRLGQVRWRNGGAAASSASDIRAWARAAGITVGARGRLGPDVTASYLASRAEVGAA